MLIQSNTYVNNAKIMPSSQQKPRSQIVTLVPVGKTNEEKLQSIKEILQKTDVPPQYLDAFIWRVLRDWRLIIEPDIETYNLMLRFFSEKGNRTAVRQVFDQILEKRLQPNTQTFNYMLAAFSASGTEISTSMVYSILSEMRRLNVPFDNDTYLAAYELFCRVGSEDTISEFKALMKSKDIKSPMTFSHELTLRIKKQQLDRVVQIFEESVNEGTPLSIEDWRRGLKALLSHTEKFKELWQLGVEKMNIVPDSYSFGMKQDSLLASRDGQGALNILSEMKAAGIEPNSGHYGRAIMGLPVEEAQAFVQKIREEKPELVDGKFLSGLLYNLEFNKRFDKLEELYASIPEVYHYKIDDTITASFLTCTMRYDLFVGLATYLQLRESKNKISTGVAAELLNQLIRIGKLDEKKLPADVREDLTYNKLNKTFLPTLDKIAKALLAKILEKASKSS